MNITLSKHIREKTMKETQKSKTEKPQLRTKQKSFGNNPGQTRIILR